MGSSMRSELPQNALRRPRRTASMPRLTPIAASRSMQGPSLRAASGECSQKSRPDFMAATDPYPLGPFSSSAMDFALSAEEVFRVGPWSVRRIDDAEVGLVYVNEAAVRIEVQPPPEILDALDLDVNGGDTFGDEPEEAGADASTTEGGSGGGSSSSSTGQPFSEQTSAAPTHREVDEAPPTPRFLRILLGAKTEVPLKMARDILEVLQEDSSMFAKVQQRFSDVPSEPALAISEGIGEELESCALALRIGEVSDVLATEAGIQILMRVS